MLPLPATINRSTRKNNISCPCGSGLDWMVGRAAERLLSPRCSVGLCRKSFKCKKRDWRSVVDIQGFLTRPSRLSTDGLIEDFDLGHYSPEH